MVVGITRLVLAIPGALSLKEKRGVVKRVLDRVRARFNVAAAEVDLQDAHQRAVLGLATVGHDPDRIRAILGKVVAFVERTGLVEVIADDTETATYGDAIGDDAYQSFAEKFGVDESWPPAGSEPLDGPAPPRFRPGSLGLGSGTATEEDE